MKKYIKNQTKILVDSFKQIDRRSIYILLYDLIFYFLVTLSLFLYGTYIKSKSEVVQRLQNMDLLQDPASATVILSDIKSFLLNITLTSILMIILIIAIAAIVKSIIWFTVAKKQYKSQDIIRFLKVRFLWVLISIGILVVLIPVFISLGFAVKIESAALMNLFVVILLLLYVIVENIKHLIYIYFTDSKKINCIKAAFKTGIKKVHLFIIPYITIAILFFLFFYIYFFPMSLIFGKLIPTSQDSVASAFLYSILPIILYSLWFRIYLYNVVKKIN